MINVITAVKHLTNENLFLEISDKGPYLVGFPAMQIMNLWGMFFHPANVSSLTFTLEVKSCSALVCDV